MGSPPAQDLRLLAETWQVQIALMVLRLVAPETMKPPAGSLSDQHLQARAWSLQRKLNWNEAKKG